MSQSAVIEVTGFSKTYDADIAVHDLSFSVDGGQVLGLIGLNGAGKTTTLRALSGIIPSSRGKLAVCGFDVDEDAIAVKQRTGYVPDDPQLFNDLTVTQHLAFTASAYGVSSWESKAEALLHRFDLAKKSKSRVSELSRGMRQKLAICCTYLYEPAALLLDEPMTGLDPGGIRTLKETIQEITSRGAAVVISSHLLAMVEDICTHVLILQAGHTRFFGTVGDLQCRFAPGRGERSLEEMFFLAVRSDEYAVS
jgi:ABC-2 type transport system ATP-binding protein